jgi:hypothetical protein
MRRLFSVAIPGILMAGVLLCAAAAAPAQRGGGGHPGGGLGGGHAGGFSGGFAGHSFGGGFSSGRFSSSAPRNFSSAPRVRYSMPARGFGNGYRPSLSAGRGAWTGRGGDRGRTRGRYRSPYRGYGVYGGYPYATGWELTPWELGYPDFLGYGNDTGYAQPDEQAAQPSGDFGDDPDDDYRTTYGSAPPFRASAVASAPVRSEPELTLVFNDGHRQSIRNYALTGNSLIVLDDAASGRQQQIPLAELNLPATEQAAQQAGLDFTPPA